MTGESYSGKYIPRYSLEIIENGTFNLKASIIGNPLTAPLTQRTHTYIIPEALNTLDDNNMPQMVALHKNCQESLFTDPASSADICLDIVHYIEDVTGDVFPYDQRIFNPEYQPL